MEDGSPPRSLCCRFVIKRKKGARGSYLAQPLVDGHGSVRPANDPSVNQSVETSPGCL